MAVELTDDQPSPWVRLQLKDTELEPGDDTQIPIQLVARRFKSSSEASYEFIHDPLAYLIEAQRTDGILDEVALDYQLEGDDPHRQPPPDAQGEASLRPGDRQRE